MDVSDVTSKLFITVETSPTENVALTGMALVKAEIPNLLLTLTSMPEDHPVAGSCSDDNIDSTSENDSIEVIQLKS